MDKKKILLVAVGHLSCDVSGGALPAALPYLRSAYGLDYQATGGIMLAYSCLSSIIQPLFGLVADRFTKPWFIPLGIALAGCGLALMGFMASYWAIFAAVAISGIGSAFFHPEGARYANKVSGQSKGVGLSIFSIGGNSGYILGPLLVAACVGAFGMPGMAVFGLFSLVMSAILLWQIVHMRPAARAVPEADGGHARVPGPEANGTRADTGREARAGDDENGMDAGGRAGQEQPRNNWHEFSKLTLVIVARSITFVGINSLIPLYWVTVFGQSKAAGALALVIFSACGIACNITGGMLSDRIGCVPVIRLAFTLMPAVVLAFSFAPGTAWAYACLPFLGFVLYASFSSQVVLGQRLLARNIGFASGITLGVASSLGGVAQPVLGWIADQHGLPVAIRMLTLVAALGAAFAWLLSRRDCQAPACQESGA